ncbi:MAG TPA: tetraacyldisaccharide 4'-kinase [Longimicrobiales bacterium]
MGTPGVEPSRPPRALAATAVERLWRGEAGRAGVLLDVALVPLELAYRAAAGIFHAAYEVGLKRAVRLPVPVASVGNVAVGGAGKTPVTRWVVDELRRRGARPAVLHGGYAPDEPALHRSWYPGVPVIEGRDRVAGGARAVDAGADVVVLDDGFQHRRLARNLDLVLVAAEDWTPQPRLLPRGPWREPPRALARADVVAVTRRTATAEAAEEVAAALRRFAPKADAVRFHLRAIGWRAAAGGAAGPGPRGEVVAVAGIARPRDFVANAEAAGVEVGEALVFRDHHAYTDEDARRIRAAARGRPVVTTAKDAVKLAPLAPELDLWILEQRAIVEAGADALARRLDALVAWSRSTTTSA